MTISRREFVRSAEGGRGYVGTGLHRRDEREAEEVDLPPSYNHDDGMIVHRALDGGDQSQRERWYWVGVWIRKTVLKNPWTVPWKSSFT